MLRGCYIKRKNYRTYDIIKANLFVYVFIKFSCFTLSKVLLFVGVPDFFKKTLLCSEIILGIEVEKSFGQKVLN